MTLSPRRLNRATLGRQLLLQREETGATDAVRRVVALQAQEPASPYLALWNRLARFDAAELDRAFTDRRVVKASLMRITLHAVSAEDYAAFHHAMQPALRASRLADRRFTSTGLSAASADALVPVLERLAARPATAADLEARLAEHLGGPPGRGVWWALRTIAPLTHAPTGGPWSFGSRPWYVAADAPPFPGSPEEALCRLVRRYLEGFGPATVADVAQFTLLPRSTVRHALRAMAADLRQYRGQDGPELYDTLGGLLPDEATPAPPRLLPMWDSVLLAYADRGRVIPPGYRRLVIRRNGDVLPTLLVDGYVAGVWRPLDGGIEATAFHRLPEEEWAGLAAEAGTLVSFLSGRDPAVYRRYARWWATLPGADVRVLPR